jgi:NAD binding domain of 6-phosphogluconate dehydrogenase
MGSALATALFNKGFATTVWNRTAAKAEPLSRFGVRIAPSAVDAVVHADFVSSLLQGYILYEAENLPLEGYIPFIKSLIPVLEDAFSGLVETIRAKDYDNTQATLDVWAACPRELIKWCGDHRVDHSLVDPQLSLMDKAVKAGKGHADFAYLYELLKKAD